MRSNRGLRGVKYDILSPEVLEKIMARRRSVEEHWAALLRIERVRSPVANAETLVHLIPDSMMRIFRALAKTGRRPTLLSSARTPLPAFSCGNNPYASYYAAAEQALIEAMVLVEAELPAEKRCECHVAAIVFTIRRLAGIDMDIFCAACAYRKNTANCRHALALMAKAS